MSGLKGGSLCKIRKKQAVAALCAIFFAFPAQDGRPIGLPCTPAAASGRREAERNRPQRKIPAMRTGCPLPPRLHSVKNPAMHTGCPLPP
ncbi:MAG: hypothetical protein V8Q28_06060 [Alistipes sp.]